jgi:4,5-DOPA dioxygenase extradiol
MNAIEDNKFTDKWIDIFKTIPKPKGILAISAHWYTKGTRITTVKEPKMVYDMSGFPKELYEINYDAITDELLIKRVEELLGTDNIIEDNTWGYDHGIWSILHRVYPEQEIPLVVLSVDAYKTPKEHYEFGKKLRELREEGYLILGSGNIVHNLGLVDFQKENGYDWAEEFDIMGNLKKHFEEDILFKNIISEGDGTIASLEALWQNIPCTGVPARCARPRPGCIPQCEIPSHILLSASRPP